MKRKTTMTINANMTITRAVKAVMAGLLMVLASAGQAATDWTAYLKPLQKGCDFPDPTKDLPALYRASIVKKTVKGNRKFEDEPIDTTYVLKDATVFGVPLKAIAYHQGYEDSAMLLYFYDNAFVKIRPQFKLPMATERQIEISRNDTRGYVANDEALFIKLRFDLKSKTIGCVKGAGA